MDEEIKTLEELRFEFQEFHHECSNDYNNKRYKKIYSFINKMETEESKQIGLALQAMLGFKLGKWGADVIDLQSTIGLTKDEWIHIKEKENSGGLDDEDIKFIDDELGV